MEYQDLLYFGYSWEPESIINQSLFIKGIYEKFPNVELRDAYNEIKGYRQEVYLNSSDSENYWIWLVAYGWIDYSLTLTLMLNDDESYEKVKNYIERAKEQYPEKFKQ